MEKKIFYRVAHIDQKEGLWYDKDGNYTGLIKNKFTFCKNSNLPMPYTESIVGWLSTTDNIDALWGWFSREDVLQLNEHGYEIFVYEASEYANFENHQIIKSDKCEIIKIIKIDGNELVEIDFDLYSNFIELIKSKYSFREFYYNEIELSKIPIIDIEKIVYDYKLLLTYINSWLFNEFRVQFNFDPVVYENDDQLLWEGSILNTYHYNRTYKTFTKTDSYINPDRYEIFKHLLKVILKKIKNDGIGI